MADSNQPVRVVAGNTGMFSILLFVTALLLAAASGLLIWWQYSMYNYVLFWPAG
ncbi:MAG: hypothetical protein ACOCXX_03090 [Planctomycetota bacterium]